MKSYTSLLMAIFAIVVFAQSSAAFIDPDAPSASHHMGELAAEIHEYLHENYGPSFGAHGIEVAAGELHDTLHDWEHGEATESDVVEAMDALDAAWKTFKQTLRQEHLLNSDDEALDVRFDMNKHAYKELRFLLGQAKQAVAEPLKSLWLQGLRNMVCGAITPHGHGGDANPANAHGRASWGRDRANACALWSDPAPHGHAYDADRHGDGDGHGSRRCGRAYGRGFR